MAVLPISLVSTRNNRVSFTSSKTRDDVTDYNVGYSNSGLAKVPLIALIAMSPLNTQQIYASELDNPVQTELVSFPQQSEPISEVVNPKYIHYQKRFRAEGKNYTMYYKDITKPNGSKKVREIYFIPDDYRQTKVIEFNHEETSPPKLDFLIYHNIGEDKEFIGAYVYEIINDGGVYKKLSREIRLPDEVANELTALGSNEREFTPPPNFKLKVVNSPSLAPKKYERMIGKDY